LGREQQRRGGSRNDRQRRHPDRVFQAQRTGAAALALFRNGASIATDSRASGIVRNQNHGILANLGANFSAARLSAAFIGGSLTGKEAGFYNAMRTYMTSQGVP